MAEPQDIPKPNQEQEAILQRAPFLKTFLNQPPDRYGKWLNELEPIGEPIEKEIAEKIGNNWWSTTLGPISLMAQEQDVFDIKLMKIGREEPKEHLIYRVVVPLFIMGYEISNRKDAFSFCVPIIDKLSKSGLFHYPVPENEVEGYSQRIFNTVWGIIQTGALIRFYTDKENQSEGGLTPKDPFRDFVQGLKSIDKLPPKDKGS